jgi:hypothetical protein
MGIIHRARAVMKINRKDTAEVTDKAKANNAGLAAHPTIFVTPNPTIVVVTNQLAAVDQAQVLAGTRAKGTAAARNVQLGMLVGHLETRLLYVQGLADTSATRDQAVATIQAAGFTVALVGDHTKPVLAVFQGPTPGSVVLDANASFFTGGNQGKSFFNWDFTADGGKTFVTLPSTPKATTSLANLTPLTTYGFRVSLTDANAITGTWSQMLPTHLVEHLPALELRAVA